MTLDLLPTARRSLEALNGQNSTHEAVSRVCTDVLGAAIVQPSSARAPSKRACARKRVASRRGTNTSSVPQELRICCCCTEKLQVEAMACASIISRPLHTPDLALPLPPSRGRKLVVKKVEPSYISSDLFTPFSEPRPTLPSIA